MMDTFVGIVQFLGVWALVAVVAAFGLAYLIDRNGR